MSHLSSIDITYNPEGTTFLSLLEIFLREGWNLNDGGKITYMPLEPKDASDWKRVPLSEEYSVWEVIKEKEKRGELIGVVIIWGDFGPGCTITYEQKGTISFLLNISRKLAPRAQRFTDVTWYIDHLIPIFSSYRISVRSVEWSEDTS